MTLAMLIELLQKIGANAPTVIGILQSLQASPGVQAVESQLKAAAESIEADIKKVV